jgi:hypothetical protein
MKLKIIEQVKKKELVCRDIKRPDVRTEYIVLVSKEEDSKNNLYETK